MLRFVQTRDGGRSHIITGLQAMQWLPAKNWDINVCPNTLTPFLNLLLISLQ